MTQLQEIEHQVFNFVVPLGDICSGEFRLKVVLSGTDNFGDALEWSSLNWTHPLVVSSDTSSTPSLSSIQSTVDRISATQVRLNAKHFYFIQSMLHFRLVTSSQLARNFIVMDAQSYKCERCALLAPSAGVKQQVLARGLQASDIISVSKCRRKSLSLSWKYKVKLTVATCCCKGRKATQNVKVICRKKSNANDIVAWLTSLPKDVVAPEVKYSVLKLPFYDRKEIVPFHPLYNIRACLLETNASGGPCLKPNFGAFFNSQTINFDPLYQTHSFLDGLVINLGRDCIEISAESLVLWYICEVLWCVPVVHTSEVQTCPAMISNSYHPSECVNACVVNCNYTTFLFQFDHETSKQIFTSMLQQYALQLRFPTS